VLSTSAPLTRTKALYLSIHAEASPSHSPPQRPPFAFNARTIAALPYTLA